MHTYTSVCAHVNTYIHSNVHTHAHTHVRTYIHSDACTGGRARNAFTKLPSPLGAWPFIIRDGVVHSAGVIKKKTNKGINEGSLFSADKMIPPSPMSGYFPFARTFRNNIWEENYFALFQVCKKLQERGGEDAGGQIGKKGKSERHKMKK